ncbi:copper homeostasis protein CutC [Bacteroidales bacterium OttesenSCG-928-A17]|nr:copper homeostasis protein CutC [Bacteroidales bacterium OttesenSCG-928-A17]
MKETTQSILIEACVESVQRALDAQAVGVGRIELCNDLAKGGITPSPGEIQIARKLLQIKLHPIIRPRGGDFVYSDLEFDIMKTDIQFCGESGCNGVVLGVLHPDGNVDVKRTRELTELAHSYSMDVTFHRAIDESCDIFRALEDVITCGCSRILTSGGKASAPEGSSVIRKMIEIAENRIVIMPGCGITKDNATQLVLETGAKEIHGTFGGGFPLQFL